MEVDDDAPEVVSSNDAEIQRLRSLHEKLGPSSSKKGKKTKRKDTAADTTKSNKVNADEGLDISVLENVDKDIQVMSEAPYDDEEEEEELDESEEESEGDLEQSKRFKIDTTRRSQRVKDAEVVTLDNRDPLGSFSLSSSAVDFNRSVKDAYERKTVGSFVKGKRGKGKIKN
jgi:hypothetical protein